MIEEQLKKKMIEAAIQAPSADNSQPFLYEWFDETTLSLYIDKSRSGKASDNRFVLSDIALGAVIENVVITAKSNGLETQELLLPSNDDYHVCDIAFMQSENEEPNEEDISLAGEVHKRTTDRRFPFKGELSEDTRSLLTVSASCHNAGVQWFCSKTEKKSALPLIQRAESIRFKSKILHEELFSTVHFGNPESKEGMPIEVLAIEKPAQPIFKQMKKWSVMSFFNKLGAYKMLGIRSVKLPIMFSPSLALITIEDNSRESVINGGRALQRFWLKCSELGIAVQPYAAPGIFSLGYIDNEPEFKPTLKTIADEMRGLVNNNKYGLMFLRLGYNKPVTARTHRRQAESFNKAY